MPTYSLYKNKLADEIIQIPSEFVDEFLEKLEEINPSAKEELEENPDGMVEIEDSYNPYPNATFTHGGFHFWIRRNQYPAGLGPYNKAIEALHEEDSEIQGSGILIFQHPFYGEGDIVDYEFPHDIEFGVTYNILFDLDDDNCEIVENTPDYSGLPPDTTRELINSLSRVRQPGEEIPGNLFAALAFSMQKEVAERLKETLPEDMAEYLEKMTSFHAVYHDENNEDLDGCEAYLLLNLPLDTEDAPLAAVEEVGYDDPAIAMGIRFIKFLEESDLSEFGEFAIYMVPQPGIIPSWEMFSTPWSIVDWFSYDIKDLAALMWGEPEYFRDEPFHMYPQCYLYVDPQYMSGGKAQAPDTAVIEELAQTSFEKGRLHETALAVFSKLKDFPAKYGFNFSYSPESSWNGNADFLIMTINPSASDGKGKAKKIVPKTPWPLLNAFFDPNNKFAIQKPVQAICYELSRLAQNPACFGDTPMEAAKNFADNCAILASFVPFRTREAGDITEEMMEFARTEYWDKLFAVWQPKVIVTLGNPPFEAMQAFLADKYKVIQSTAEKVSDTSTLSYRMGRYETKNGRTITLIGLPHPTAFGEKGFPTNFPENADGDSPLRAFLAKFIKNADNDGEPSRQGDAKAAASEIIRRAVEARKAKRRETGLED